MDSHTQVQAASGSKVMTREEKKVILASSLGTVFEWYDFYLYGALAAIISKQFFSGVNETAGFIFALLAFAAGFAVRPFGALVFGRLGDLVGRKYTFLVTILLMGASTFIVGILPTYAQIGIAAPIILIILRLLQGLALGGEYGGAATYVAEHAPYGKRGAYTAWIQTTATVGLFLSLLVILGTKMLIGNDAFNEWGWRVPFLLSIVLLGISVWIRMKLNESPLFAKMKAEGKASKSPIKESFGQWANLKIVLLALFGLTAGQAVVWYTGQFYALFFLTQTLKVDANLANMLVACALLIGTPLFIVFGSLSDKIGRKKIILTGCLLAAFTYIPIFKGITMFANPQLNKAQVDAPITVYANQASCSLQFNPVGTSSFKNDCDMLKSFLAKNGLNYKNENLGADESKAYLMIGQTRVDSFDGTALAAGDFKEKSAALTKALQEQLKAAGYPAKADSQEVNKVMIVLLLSLLMVYVAMVYGPIAALLVEMFPMQIRYTSMSLPYHIGNGWFGGFLPTTSFAIVAATGNIYDGLWYPIAIALMTVVIGGVFLKENKGDIDQVVKEKA